jgi:hypothetical protein
VSWAGGLAFLLFAILDREEIFPSVGGTIGTTSGVLALAAAGCFSWAAAIVVTITDTTVRISYRPFRAFTIPRADIASVGTETLNPSAFGGVGLRFMPPHDRALLFTAGSGLVIERTSRFTRYHVRSDQVQRIVALLREQPADTSAQS